MEENMTLGGDIAEFLQLLEKWHESRATQLKMIIDNEDTDLMLEDHKIKADSDMAKGIRVGVAIALDSLGDLPFSVSQSQESPQ